MITLQGVTRSYGSRTILDFLNLDFAAGLTHVILGRSGCGKSTLLKLILGLLPPDFGTITVGETVVSTKTQKQVALQTGYVIQEGGLFPHLTVEENITLVARLQKWDKEKIQARLQSLSELVGLHKFHLAAFPKELSGGQRQRVGLARALMLDPPILIFDEPLGSLDPLIRSGLQIELKNLFQTLKKTVLLVTHDIGEAAFFGDTITLIEQGRVLQKGTITDLIKTPKDPFVTEFLRAQKPPPALKEIQ